MDYFDDPRFVKILLGVLRQESVQQMPVFLAIGAAVSAHSVAFPELEEHAAESPAVSPRPSPETFGGAETIALLRRSV